MLPFYNNIARHPMTFSFSTSNLQSFLLYRFIWPFTEQHWKSYLPSHCDEDPEWTEALQHTSGLWLLRSLHEGSPVQLWIPRLDHTEASPLPEETVQGNNIRLRKFMPQQHIWTTQFIRTCWTSLTWIYFETCFSSYNILIIMLNLY